MHDLTCIFVLENQGPRELVLILEPEGSQFPLPPGEMVEVHLFGSDMPTAIKHSTGEDGRCYVSFWSDRGDYQLLYKGSDVSGLIERSY